MEESYQMNANEKQVGGTHYKSSYQHWDFMTETQLEYLPATATKYLSRWKKKNGLEDLYKAKHYIDKYIEVMTAREKKLLDETAAFISLNEIYGKEQYAIYSLIHYKIGNLTRLNIAAELVQQLINDEKYRIEQKFLSEETQEFLENPTDEWLTKG